ncbi:hypothetical protein pdam_00012190 [Pocillopora damicornis]|uniref:Uncharacterized protein n=1 Tax=Pocillopora damicornis TaxID=46731 RepID=A0A3M6UE02_POCDA|nr:hypothetical protein pdam_00012190 [Pocillopora damicornis]
MAQGLRSLPNANKG